MILRSETTLLCDVDGCTRATTRLGPPDRAREAARFDGWTVRVLDGGEVTLDRCPQHGPSRPWNP